MIRREFARAAALAAVLWAPAATAGPEGPPHRDLACGVRDAMVTTLAERYGEVPVSLGLESGGRLIEMFASARTGTWTILATREDGTSCVMAVGDHFEQRRIERPASSARDKAPDRRGRPG